MSESKTHARHEPSVRPDDPKHPYGKLPRPSTREGMVLQLLFWHGEMYGLQMIESSKGVLKRGLIYVTLSQMEEKGFISSREDAPHRPGWLPLRLYKLTTLGSCVLLQERRKQEANQATRKDGSMLAVAIKDIAICVVLAVIMLAIPALGHCADVAPERAGAAELQRFKPAVDRDDQRNIERGLGKNRGATWEAPGAPRKSSSNWIDLLVLLGLGSCSLVAAYLSVEGVRHVIRVRRGLCLPDGPLRASVAVIRSSDTEARP